MTSNLSLSSSSSNSPQKLPVEMKELLLEFSIAYLIEQPNNLVDFAVEHFRKLQKYAPVKPKVKAELSYDSRSVDDDHDYYDDGDTDGDDVRIARPLQKHRRETIFATGYGSQDEESADHAVHAKTDEECARLADTVNSVFIFRTLDAHQLKTVLDAMFVREVKAGERIMTQGGQPDNCYVIESGKYRAFKNGKLIATYDNYGIFGELALLYNKRRAATVDAETDGKLWVVDRITFRRILLKTAYDKRKVYEELLNNTPILNALSHYERMNLADALTTRTYKEGQRVFRQGDEADGMYFIVKGIVSVRIEQGTAEIELTRLTQGQYFGELALITHRPRAASIYAVDGPIEVAFIENNAFERMLGFLTDVLKRNVLIYEQNFAEISRRVSF